MTNINQLNDAFEETLNDEFLTFSLADEFFAIDIMQVTEIVGIQPITVMPDLPSFLKGVINLRGVIIPVLDARDRFGKPCIDYNDRTCIIVVKVLGISFGIVVDAVSEVLSLGQQNIIPPPLLVAGEENFVKSIGKKDNKIILILDFEKILSEDDLNSMKTINE